MHLVLPSRVVGGGLATPGSAERWALSSPSSSRSNSSCCALLLHCARVSLCHLDAAPLRAKVRDGRISVGALTPWQRALVLRLRGGGGCWGHFPCAPLRAGDARRLGGRCCLCAAAEPPTPEHCLWRCAALRAQHAARDRVFRDVAQCFGKWDLWFWLQENPGEQARMAAQLGVVSVLPAAAAVPGRAQARVAERLARATAEVAVAYVEAARAHGGVAGAHYEPGGGS